MLSFNSMFNEFAHEQADDPIMYNNQELNEQVENIE